MVSGAKKNLFKAFLAATLAVLAALTLFSYARTDASVSAEAAEDYKWSASVRTRTSEGSDPNANFVVVNQPIDVFSDTEIDFFVRVSSEIAAGSTFKYCKSATRLDTDAQKAAATWVTISKNSGNTASATEDGQLGEGESADTKANIRAAR